jgi:hypothetical protein
VHELKHLIASGVRILNDRDVEELWLEEASAVAAEELAGFGSQLGDPQAFASAALSNPAAFSVYTEGRPTSLEQNYALYGFNFLLLWRLAEQRGHDTFWKSWVAGPTNSFANLEVHAGRSFESLMADFALTVLLDHANVLAGYDFQSLNLRDGSWDLPELKPLVDGIKGSVKSMSYYAATGQGQDATLVLKSEDLAPHFLIVRHPL